MCSSRTNAQPLPKKRKLTGYVPAKQMFFVPKETWTHDFCVLGRQEESITPSRARLNKLLDAGLGKARLSVKKTASHQELSSALEERFPKLKSAGGFEVLRAEGGGGGQRQLCLVHPSAFGYTAPHLKDKLGQALAYIRPLQCDLDEEPVLAEVVLSPKVNCLNCGKIVAMQTMRDHQLECTGGSSSRDVTGMSVDVGKKEPWSMLKEVFPGCETEQYKEVWDSCGGNLALAVAKLGGWVDEDSTADDTADCEELPIITGILHEEQNGNKTESGSNAELDASEVIKSYRREVVDHRGSTQFISVNRMQISLLMQLMRTYKDPKLDMKKPLNVNFQGEQGADVGGPTKEYFHEAISALSKVDPVYNIQLFGGEEGHLIPLYGVDAISSGCFEMAGKLIAHSVLHEGPGMVGLSPAVIKYLITGSVDEAKELVTTQDLYDTDLQEILETQFQDESEIKDIDCNVRGRVEDMLVKHGLTDAVPLNDVNKIKAIKDLLVAEVLITRTLALDSFHKGLNVHGLGDLLRKHPGVSCYVLPTKEEVRVDVEVFKGKLVFCDDHPTEEEAQSMRWLLQFVEEAALINGESDGNAHHNLLRSLLLFTTGSTVMDSSLKMEVIFQSNAAKPLLEADSCFNRLTIPTCHQSYEEFKKACSLSVQAGALGYGRF